MSKTTIFTILIVLITFSLQAKYVEVVSSSISNLELKLNNIEFQITEVALSDNNTYYKVIVPGAAQNLPGLPDLPIFGNWILVPNGSNINISVQEGEPVVYENIQLAPVQHFKADLIDAVEPQFIINDLVYSDNISFPGNFAETESLKKKRGQSCTILWIYPYQYNPVTDQLLYYPELQVSLTFSGNFEPIPSNLYRAENRGFWSGLAINSEEILSGQETIADYTETFTREDGYDLLIITHPLFDGAAQTLASWKRKKALRTKVVSLDETGYETESIDAYINYTAANWDPAPLHLLLIGDSEFLPTWYVTEHPYDGGQGYTAADVYYADIDEPQDLIADMSVGRIPVSSPQEADDFIAKIIQYEQNPPEQSDFYNNVTCAAYFQHAGNGYAERRFAKTSEDVRNFLHENYYDVNRIYYTQADVEPLYWNVYDYVFENDSPGEPLPDEIRKPQFPWNGNSTDINQALNIGSFFVLHRDHGYRLGWGDPAYSVYDLSGVNNGNLLPMIWTINCNTGWFDNETDDTSCGTAYDSESFVEDFMNHSGGGTVGMIGSTRVSYSGNNDRLVWGFMDAIWPEFLNWTTADYPDHEPIYKMGDVVNYGKEYFMVNSTWGGDVRTTTLEQFLWFGDPTTEMWTSQPEDLLVTYDMEIALGSTEYEVLCDVENADVALILDNKVLANGKIFNGTVTLTFPPIVEIGDLELGVSAHNYIPYVTEIDIIPTGPYVVCETVDFIEAGDYIDGSIQALDTVNINLNLYNIGIEPTGDEISITLSTESDFVEILSGSVTCSGIEDSTNYTLENAFQIELLPGMLDGSLIEFSLEMQSADYTWPGSFQMPVNAPILEFISYTLNHLDGNDNITDPGENLEISFEYINSGNGFSYDVFTTLTSNDPYVQISGMDIIDQIDPGTSITSTYPLNLYITPDCPADHYIELSLLAFDNAGSVLIRDFSIPIGILVYNFDDGSGVWENENLSENYLNEWHLSSYRNSTSNGEFSMKCGGMDEVHYSNNVYAALYTPLIQAVPGTLLRFSHWINTGLIGDSLSWDGGILEVSVNGGEFIQIEPVGGYPATIINLDIFPFAGGTQVFAGEIDWEVVEVDLSDHQGEVQVRFVFGSSPTMYTMEGWYIDDVQIVNYTDSENDEIIPVTTSLAQNHPNPFNPETTISFSLSENEPVTLEIFNIRGQKIKTLVDENYEAGNYDISWQGTDDSSNPVSSGIYFYRLKTDRFTDIKKMILMK
jgi:peptidase C25-like protein/flagellar hook capping protein FlgD